MVLELFYELYLGSYKIVPNSAADIYVSTVAIKKASLPCPSLRRRHYMVYKHLLCQPPILNFSPKVSVVVIKLTQARSTPAK